MMEYGTVSETQTKEKDDAFSILIYLRFSEADVGLILQEENGLVAQGTAIISREFQVRPH